MAMRLTGLMSGMDTESIIQELVAVKRTKVDDAKKAQTKLSWKQDAWKSLNTQIRKLYDGALSNMRFQSSYIKKTTKVSNPNVVSVITGEGAMNSVQSLKVTNLAQSAYMTGGKLQGTEDYKKTTSLTASVEDGGLGIEAGSEINMTVNGESTTITITEGMTINSFVSKLQETGVNVSFDEKNQRFFISAKKSGEDQSFTLVGANASGTNALDALGLTYYGDNEKAYYEKLAAAEANEDKKAEIIAEREKTTLDSLLAEQEELLSNKAEQEAIATRILGKDIDFNNLQDIRDKIDELKTDGKTTDYKELENWVDNYTKITNELDTISDKLVQDTDIDGNPVYTLHDEEKASIANQVEAEITYAAEVLTKIENSTNMASKIEGEDAVIELNGVEYKSDSNTFEINGLTMTVSAETAENETVTITTEDDTDGIYDMIKDFFKEYNALINQMDKLYNADSAKGYEPLTDEEKEAMSESEIEEWETKIKDALLRKDSTLGTVSSALKEIMASDVTVNGKKMYLSDFGIETLGYFTAPENERNAYHIDGDTDDAYTSGNADKLKSMIASDPDTVVSFFSSLSKSLYSKVSDLMKGTEYSSSYTVYDDKKMQEDYDDYTTEIKELEEKLADYEDKWYAKFAAMETAMAKLQSNASAVTSLLGG